MIDIQEITLGQLVTAIGFIIILVGYINQALKPLKDFTKRIDQIEQHQDNDNKRLNKLEQETHLILKATRVLVSHSVDNNHTGDLKKMQDEIDDYLVNK